MRNFMKILFGFVLISLIILFSAAIFETFLTSKEIMIKIKGIETPMDTEGNRRCFIITEGETFMNENNYYHGKSNQEELLKLLEKDKTYKVQVVGYKLGFEIPFFISKYRNIIKISR